MKIRAPYYMHDNYSRNTCSGVREIVMKMVVMMVMVIWIVECDGEVPMN